MAILLGTLTTGLMMFASAAEDTAVPSYANLQAKYGSEFFYAGTELYEGDNLTNGIVSPGSELKVKFYVKTDYPLYTGMYYVVIDDVNAIDKVNRTMGEDNKPNDGMTALAKTNGSGANFCTNAGVVNIDGYTKEQIDNWYIISINDGKNAQVTRDTATGDNPLVEFSIKIKDNYEGSFNCFLVQDSFTSAYGGKQKTRGFSALNDYRAKGTAATGTNAAVKATNFELQGAQAIEVSKLAVFKGPDGSIIEEKALETGDKVTAPAVDNLYGWADLDGKITDLTDLTMGDYSLVYKAVLNSYEVDVNLIGNGGTVDGAETKTIKVKIGDGFDPSKYTAQKEGDDFQGWGINGLQVLKLYKFADTNPVDATALWNNNVMTVFIPTASTLGVDKDTGVQTVIPGELVPLCHVVGEEGAALTKEKADEITKLAQDTLAEDGADLAGFGFDVTAMIPIAYLAIGQDEAGNDAYRLMGINGGRYKNCVFGTTKALVMDISASLNVYFHYPEFDADGNWDGESWIDYRLLKDGAVESTATDADASSEDLYEDTAEVYRPVYDFSVLDLEAGELDVEKLKSAFYKGVTDAYSKPLVSNAYDIETGGIIVELSRLKTVDNDPNTILKYHYSNTFTDGQGNQYNLTSDKKYLDIKRSNYSMGEDEEGNAIPLKNRFDVYTYPYEREYSFALNAVKSADDSTINKYVVAKNFKYGDEITAADLTELYTTELGSDKITIEELKTDAGKVKLNGYFFKELLFKAEGLDEVNFTNGGTLTLDGALIDALTELQGGFTSLYGVSVITLTGIFEPKSFDFVIKYTNAEGKQVELLKVTFKGNESFSYSDVITEELKKKIDADCQVGKMVNTNGFLDKDGNQIFTVKAFEGPYELFINYAADSRVAFIDYANGKENGYFSYTLPYGTPLYREDYDPDGKYGSDDYRFNQYILSGTKFATRPLKEQKTDNDGNPMYEPVLVEEKDSEGNVIINDVTGKPNMIPKTDENGSIIYDESKPIYKDPKGEVVERPYRNCEYVGYKIYHLDHPVFSWADVPAQDEWIEGYENENCELYNTDILQLQWKPDTDFLLRIYNTDNVGLQLSISPFSISFGMNGNLYSALGKDFKWYYWDNEGKPCKRGEGTLNTKPEEQIIILLWPTIEKIPETDLRITTETDADAKTVSSWYLTAVPLGRDFLKPSLIPTLLPTILKAVRGLIN